MSSVAELKERAKELLKAKKGKIAWTTIVYLLILTLLFIPCIILHTMPALTRICLFLFVLLMPVLTYGLIKSLIDFKNGEEVGIFDFFFKRF